MKQKNYLMLDDEFIQYCKLNNIEDIESFAKQVFNKGFTIIKYGDKPKTIIKPLTEGKIKTNIKESNGVSLKAEPPPAPIPKQKIEEPIKDKNNLYDE